MDLILQSDPLQARAAVPQALSICWWDWALLNDGYDLQAIKNSATIMNKKKRSELLKPCKQK